MLHVGPARGVQSSAGREARWMGPQVLISSHSQQDWSPHVGSLPGVGLALPGQLPLQPPKDLACTSPGSGGLGPPLDLSSLL